MYSSKELDNYLKRVSSSSQNAMVAQIQYLREIEILSNEVRKEGNKDIEQFLNKKYLLISPKYFGVQNCLSVRNTGDNLKYIRFIEPAGDKFELSKLYDVAMVQKGIYFLGLFGGDEKLVEYFNANPEFRDYFDINADYLFLASYLNGEVGFDLCKNIGECVFLKV